jgi:hypothetical protein
MLDNIWSFLLDENTRAVLAWIGGGIVVVAGGVWAVLKFILSKQTEKNPPAPSVTATHGGVAAGGNISGSKIDTGREIKR